MMIFVLLSLYFVQSGITQFKNIKAASKDFQDIERLKVDNYIDYKYYGAAGFRVMLIPGPSVIFFFNSTAVSDLLSNVDSGSGLKVTSSFLGSNLFEEKTGGFKDLSGIILLFGSLLALYWGHETFKPKEYMKFLSSLISLRKLYFWIIISRTILISLFFTIITCFSIALVALNKISFQKAEFLHLSSFLFILILVILFFFAVGTALGSIQSKPKGIGMCFAAWFVFIFLLPGLMNSYISSRAKQMTSNFEMEWEKVKLLLDFEKRAILEEGKFRYEKRNTQAERDLAESYFNIEFRKIQETDKKRENEMREYARFHNTVSALIPSTFYFSVSREISSRGYRNVLDFYQYTRELKDKFVRFHLNKKFYSDKDEKVENFVKSEENLFYGASNLPGTFVWGTILMLIYIGLIFEISFYRFKKSMLVLSPGDIENISAQEIEFKKGEFSTWKINGDSFSNLLYCLFSRDNKRILETGCRVTIDDEDITETEYQEDFLYIGRADSIPEHARAEDFILLSARLMKVPGKATKQVISSESLQSITRKRIHQLSEEERREILMALTRLRPFNVYIVNDITVGLSIDFALRLNDMMESLTAEGAIAIYLTSTYIDENTDESEGISFFRETSWFYDIKRLKRLRKISNRDNFVRDVSKQENQK
jgi:ABC-type transport system involved in multi-copper enzyme maturation permease subunit/ABC-type transport system involved in cytochrome c biogenesis ATPase subunit